MPRPHHVNIFEGLVSSKYPNYRSDDLFKELGPREYGYNPVTHAFYMIKFKYPKDIVYYSTPELLKVAYKDMTAVDPNNPYILEPWVVNKILKESAEKYKLYEPRLVHTKNPRDTIPLYLWEGVYIVINKTGIALYADLTNTKTVPKKEDLLVVKSMIEDAATKIESTYGGKTRKQKRRSRKMKKTRKH